MSATIKMTGDWDAASKFFGGIKTNAIKRALEAELHVEAHYLAKKVKERIKKGPHKPLSKLTLASRKLAGFGGTKPLIAGGDLFSSVTVSPPEPNGLTKFVGVLRSAKGKDGKSLVNIGQIQEEGRTIVIKLTPKMRKYLFGVLFPAAGISTSGGGGGGRGFIVVRIPPRPFIGPVFDEYGGDAPARIQQGTWARLAEKYLPSVKVPRPDRK